MISLFFLKGNESVISSSPTIFVNSPKELCTEPAIVNGNEQPYSKKGMLNEQGLPTAIHCGRLFVVVRGFDLSVLHY